MMDGKRILVTGGAGFIGSNLVEELVRLGHDVVVLDNLQTGSIHNLGKDLDTIIFKECACEDIVASDILDMDFIFHLGSPSSSQMYIEDSALAGKAIAGFSNILEMAKINGCPIVYASSSSVYRGCPLPYREDAKLVPFDHYTKVRVEFEKMAKEHYERHKTSSVALRLFSVYGPNEESKKGYANLVSQFLWSMIKDESPVIYGNGEQTRDFIHVKDVVRACVLSVDKLCGGSIGCDIFNVGTGRRISLNELVTILNGVLRKDIRPEYVENPVRNYIVHTLANTSKAEHGLGFKSEMALEAAIDEMV